MSFSFGTSTTKSATGFTLPVNTTAGATPAKFSFSGGAGDPNSTSGTEAKAPNLFGSSFGLSSTTVTTSTPSTFLGPSLTTSASTGLTFGQSATPSAPQFSLGSSLATTTTTASSILNFGATPISSAAPAFSLTSTTTTTSTPISFSTLGAVSTSAPAFPAGTALTTLTTSGISTLPATGSMTFAQLEDTINKWTSDLEEQGKLFGNQARHLNAWDRLLISNAEKILGVSNGIERIKQQQDQLDQDLDFVLAQQKELEDCIAPLEKELSEIVVSDVDRDQTYKLAENIDTQLKQMSEDLKEIIEHLNEDTNKVQEASDPIAQIGRILNAHMNSLQWIDRNTSQISSHLDEISKMHDLNRRNHETLHGA
ncbi:hypothetical protein PPYR_01629 [Photinus pyralis]|uniref:Nucleoporin NSP1-like C-terminal domain-containing protein n=2 Tax=Photinus pyralis TaxID=7054 RepID=A0A5N4B4V6_PHOPY|nr:nuclear pore glycoprotein p62 [Photinus pyralis]KAB0804659.1 hypothetical protein PPYR_01629 [Photinus pyralis]